MVAGALYVALACALGAWRRRRVVMVADAVPEESEPWFRGAGQYDAGGLRLLRMLFVAALVSTVLAVGNVGQLAALVKRLFPAATAADTASFTAALGDVVVTAVALSVIAMVGAEVAVTSLQSRPVIRRALLAVCVLGVAASMSTAVLFGAAVLTA